MAEEKPTILIVEDDLDVADMLNAYFRVQGYEILTVNWGEDGVRASETSRPDLIILDIRLPDIDGYEVAKRIRANRNTQNIPILFLTDKRSRKDKLKGLEIGGDDYITKPFDIQELRLRVRNALERNQQGPITHPVTGLPEGNLMDERLSEIINTKNWAVLLITLENLESFRESYGFVASDDVLRAVSLMVQNTLRDIGAPDDFLGHMATSQLGLVTTTDSLSKLRKKIKSRLSQSLDYFYPVKDREKISKSDGSRLTIRIDEINEKMGPFNSIAELKEKFHVSF